MATKTDPPVIEHWMGKPRGEEVMTPEAGAQGGIDEVAQDGKEPAGGIRVKAGGSVEGRQETTAWHAGRQE
jgi:hypothetical protein